MNHFDHGDCNFYCSDGCKNACSIFGKHSSIKVSTNSKCCNTTDSVVWASEVLKRANYECEYCGEKATDAHHIKPKKLEPFFALDPDYGIACCEKCHYKYGHGDRDCSFGTLRYKQCL